MRREGVVRRFMFVVSMKQELRCSSCFRKKPSVNISAAQATHRSYLRQQRKERKTPDMLRLGFIASKRPAIMEVIVDSKQPPMQGKQLRVKLRLKCPCVIRATTIGQDPSVIRRTSTARRIAPRCHLAGRNSWPVPCRQQSRRGTPRSGLCSRPHHTAPANPPHRHRGCSDPCSRLPAQRSRQSSWPSGTQCSPDQRSVRRRRQSNGGRELGWTNSQWRQSQRRRGSPAGD